MDNADVATEGYSSSNEPVSAVLSSRHAPPALHRSLTATSRKPLRSSPLAGPAVVSLNDPPIDIYGSSTDLLSPPASLHLRSKSKSAQTLARPVSLYTNYSFDHSVGNSRSGHSRRPSTAPGPDTDVTTSRKRFSLTSPAVEPFFKDIRVPQRPLSVLVSLQEADAVHDADWHPRMQPSVDIPERGSLAPAGSNNGGNNLMVPVNRFSLAESSGGASARVRYSYASSSAGLSNRPVSFIIGAESDVEADTRQSWRTSYHSTTPKPILKHSNSGSSSIRPSTPPLASSSSSPTSSKSTSAVSDAEPSTRPITTRLSGSFKDMDDSWYTFSPYATTPKFSRLGLAAPGVVMPISAKEMAKRKPGLSHAASVKAGKQSSDMLARKSVSRRTSLAIGTTSPPRSSTSRVSNTVPGDKALAPEWLSIPPPARSSSRVRSKTSQSSLHVKTHGLSTASSLAQSAASSAASSSSSLRSFPGIGHKGRSSTSTAASTPLSSAPSSVSLRSWKSVRTSLSSLASPITIQSLTKASSTSNLAFSSAIQALPPDAVSSGISQHHEDGLQAVEKFPHPILVNAIVETSRSRAVRKRKSGSGLLGRMRGWQWRGKAVTKREEKMVDAVISNGTSESSANERNDAREETNCLAAEEPEEEGVMDAVEVQEELLPSEGVAVRLVVDVAKPDIVREEKSEIESDNALPPSSSSDSDEHDADDEREGDQQEHEAGHTIQETPRHEDSDSQKEARYDRSIHSPASAFSLLDLNPGPATTAATLIVIPIPSPNLHVDDPVPAFLRQPDSDAKIDEILSGELDPAPISQTHHEIYDIDDPFPIEDPVSNPEVPSPANFTSLPASPKEIDLTHREKRSGSMRKILNVIVCGACAAEPNSPTEPVPAISVVPSSKT